MASGFAARNGGRAGVAALIAILLLGLGLRLGEAWDGRAPVYDASAYAAIAANLERGDGFTVGPGATQPSSNYSPGLPLLVAGIYEVSGGVHERTARVALALLGTLSILFTYRLSRRLSRLLRQAGPGRSKGASNTGALVAAAVVAIYPALLEYQGMLMSEPLAATLLSGAVLALFWAADPRATGPEDEPGLPPDSAGRALRWLLPGVLLGALAMVRPEYLGIGVLLALVVLARPLWRRARDGARDGAIDTPRRGLAQAAILIAGLVLVVAPWTLRNAIALERTVPISTGGGQVLFAGTYPPSDGDPERVGAEVVAHNPQLFGPNAAAHLRLEQILARLAAARYPQLETDQALSRLGKDQLWDDVSEEPLPFAGFVAAKVWRIWSQGPRAVMREPLWRAFHLALVALGLLGLGLLAWRRRWEALVLAAVFLGITALSALLVASPRRVLVLVPLVAALAGVAATWLWSRLSPGRT